jgi:hypothetical protein
MDACICRSDRIFGMHIVRQRDIDGIDVPAPKAIIILLIGIAQFHTIAPAELPQFFRVVGNQRSHGRVAPGMGKCRQHGNLRNMPQANNGVTNLACPFVLNHCSPATGLNFPPLVRCGSSRLLLNAHTVNIDQLTAEPARDSNEKNASYR